MVPPQVDDRTTEAQQERAQQLLLLQRQHHQLMLPSLLLEVPTQQGTLLGRQRVYESWQGDNIFCCGGRLVTGPEPFHLAVSFLLLLGPCFVYYQSVMPLVPEADQFVCSTVVFSLLALCLLMLFTVAFTDPGIIPRGTAQRAERWKESVLNGHTLIHRWCSTCNVYRPPRAKHCYTCNNCVACFDHHCPWISNCVGMRNRRSFFVLISLCTALSFAIVFSATLASLAELERAQLQLSFKAFWKIITTHKAIGAEVVFCGAASLLLLNLACFNSYLIAKNLTTAEEFHRPYGDGNPFSQGWKLNCYHFWCVKTQPCEVNFRAFEDVLGDGVEAGPNQPMWQRPLQPHPQYTSGKTPLCSNFDPNV